MKVLSFLDAPSQQPQPSATLAQGPTPLMPPPPSSSRSSPHSYLPGVGQGDELEGARIGIFAGAPLQNVVEWRRENNGSNA